MLIKQTLIGGYIMRVWKFKQKDSSWLWNHKPIHQKLSKKNIKNDVDHKCLMCDQYFETIDHLVPGCNIMSH